MTTMTDQMTGQQWLDKHGVTFEWSGGGYHADADGWEHQRFTLTLRRPLDDQPELHTGLDLPWKQGMGIEDEPTPDSTLWAVASDVLAGEMTWEDFAAEYGYDPLEAPLSQYRTWEACDKLRADVQRFCTPEMFEDFVKIVEA